MFNKKQLSNEELNNIHGGTGNGTTYVASVFRDGTDEYEVDGYYNNQEDALYAAYDALRNFRDRLYIIKVYTYEFGTDVKSEVYSETINSDDYYKKID